MNQKSNSELYPEAWEFFIEHARNVKAERLAGDKEMIADYRISKPDQSGEFFYNNHPGILFCMLRDAFYRVSLQSPSVYGKIQYIVQNFAH